MRSIAVHQTRSALAACACMGLFALSAIPGPPLARAAEPDRLERAIAEAQARREAAMRAAHASIETGDPVASVLAIKAAIESGVSDERLRGLLIVLRQPAIDAARVRSSEQLAAGQPESALELLAGLSAVLSDPELEALTLTARAATLQAEADRIETSGDPAAAQQLRQRASRLSRTEPGAMIDNADAEVVLGAIAALRTEIEQVVRTLREHRRHTDEINARLERVDLRMQEYDRAFEATARELRSDGNPEPLARRLERRIDDLQREMNQLRRDLDRVRSDVERLKYR